MFSLLLKDVNDFGFNIVRNCNDNRVIAFSTSFKQSEDTQNVDLNKHMKKPKISTQPLVQEIGFEYCTQMAG